MNKYVYPFIGEAKKQIRLTRYSKYTIFSYIIWPLLSFYVTYLTYKTFEISNLYRFGITSDKELLLFLVTGSSIFNCFWIMVINSLKIRIEREDGTLEETFASSANKLAIIYGRACGNFFEFCWVYIFFIVSCSLFSDISFIEIVSVNIFLFFIVLLSSVIWGGFINVLFVISRDSNFLFSLFNTPMEIFSGVGFPINSLPKFVLPISYLFPITYSLIIVRDIYLQNRVSLKHILIYILINLVVVIATIIILNKAISNNKKRIVFHYIKNTRKEDV